MFPRSPRPRGPVPAMALIALLAAFLPGPALAQTTGACCIPEAACEFESAYQCMRDGGVFLPGAEICICSRPNLGIGMSQTAARRLLRERVVHTLYVERSADVYTDQRYVDLIANGVIIAPTFTYDLRHGPVTDRVVNAEAGAAAILLAVEAARADWNTEHAPPNTLPFHWAIRLDAFGSSYIFQQGPASVLPAFANHPGDVTGDKLTNHEYIYQDGVVASASDYRTFTVTDTTFFGQFDDPYYLLPTAARVKFGDHEAAIEGFDRGTGTFTLVSSFTGTATGSFTISRTDAGTAGLLPCYFFKNGQEDVGEWVTAFCTYMAGNRPAGLSEPVAVIVSAEDFDLSGVDFSNYLDYLNDNEGRDVNSEYLIDANHTLQQWNDEFAVDQDNNPLDFTPEATPFSPLNADVRSYLMNTLQTAYNTCPRRFDVAALPDALAAGDPEPVPTRRQLRCQGGPGRLRRGAKRAGGSELSRRAQLARERELGRVLLHHQPRAQREFSFGRRSDRADGLQLGFVREGVRQRRVGDLDVPRAVVCECADL